jgi:chromosome segregation ATPase
MNNVDLRVSEIEEFIKLLNPEDIDLNIITTLENKLKELQEQHKVYDSFHKTITKQIEELSFSFQQQIDELVNIYFLDTINDRILSIQDQLKKNITALAEHNKKLTEHAGHLDNINSKLESMTTSINRNASDIGDLRNRIFNNESWYKEIEQQLTNIQNTISNNISDINDLKSKIPGINNRLDSIDDKLDEFDDRITEIKEDVSLLENRVLSLEEQSLTFATKALVNSLELKAYINEEEKVITIKLMLDDESLSSVDIPFFAKKEEEERDRIAKTMNAWTNYSITATENESLDTTARVDKGLTDYSTTN